MSWSSSPKKPNEAPRTKPKQNESKLQQACVKWFRFAYPQLIIFSIPNGGSRNVIEAVRLKEEGLLAGVCDLFLPKPNQTKAGLFIEMKTPGNKPTLSQMDFIQKMRALGYTCEICYSFDDFRATVENYLAN